MIISRIYKILTKYGLYNCFVGVMKFFRNKRLQRIYKFDNWHLTPINFRPYAQHMCTEIDRIVKNNQIIDPIVEIGCGLGEILSGIKSKNRKFGFDISKEAIYAARKIDKSIDFEVGSFEDLKTNKCGVLIIVNFIHAISPTDLKADLETILSNNSVKLIVFDIVINSEKSHYKYSHNGSFLFKDLPYHCVYKSGTYEVMQGAKRHIEYWLLND